MGLKDSLEHVRPRTVHTQTHIYSTELFFELHLHEEYLSLSRDRDSKSSLCYLMACVILKFSFWSESKTHVEADALQLW